MRTIPSYLVPKAAWYTISRFTMNRNHADAGYADRGLAIWLGPGYYHFTTYTNNNNNMVQNIEYTTRLDGEWNYIHYAYKRNTSTVGNAKGWVYFSVS